MNLIVLPHKPTRINKIILSTAFINHALTMLIYTFNLTNTSILACVEINWK